jgi:hypothetical protein
MRAMPFLKYASTLVRDNLNLFYSVSQIFSTGQVIFGVHMDEVFAVVFPTKDFIRSYCFNKNRI